MFIVTCRHIFGKIEEAVFSMGPPRGYISSPVVIRSQSVVIREVRGSRTEYEDENGACPSDL
jgi:hypothetical protein